MQQRRSITVLARDLRNNPTPSKRFLWQHLHKRQLGGYRFVRQKPFVYDHQNNRRYFYIADFYCAKENLVIELDGKIHEYQKRYDYDQDLVLKNLGLTTLRIKNEDLKYLDMVKNKIFCYLE